MEYLYNALNIKQLMAEHLAKQVMTEMVEPDELELFSKTRNEDSEVSAC